MNYPGHLNAKPTSMEETQRSCLDNLFVNSGVTVRDLTKLSRDTSIA